MQDLGGMERPVGVSQHLARQQHDVSLAGGHYLLGLGWLGDQTDRSAGNPCFSPDPGRKGDLEAGAERNRLTRHRKP